MKIVTLIENRAIDGLTSEHGLSIYVELDNRKILFDTGQGRNFIENAKRLNIDLEGLDYVIISHGHYDHAGGVVDLVDICGVDPIFYFGREFFLPKYKFEGDGSIRYIGVPFEVSPRTLVTSVMS